MTTTTVFKVVRLHRGVKVSAALPVDHGGIVVYNEHQWVQPKYGLLMAFSVAGAAMAWARGFYSASLRPCYYNFEVWEAEAELYAKQEDIAWVLPPHAMQEERMKEFWSNALGKRAPYIPAPESRACTPNNTVFCLKLRLIRDIPFMDYAI